MHKSLFSSEISEFSFGYLATLQLSLFQGLSPHLYFTRGRRIVIDQHAPIMPTQRREKTLGIDVFFTSMGCHFFLQYKRSRAVSAQNFNMPEWKYIGSSGQLVGDELNKPFYRVYFYRNGDYAQRDTLYKLESKTAVVKNAIVRYCAPCFHTIRELNFVYNNGIWYKKWPDGKSRHPLVFFAASHFSLPNKDSCHHISFDGISKKGHRFSVQAQELDVEFLADIENIAQERAQPLYRSISQLRKALDELAAGIELPPVERDPTNADLLELVGIYMRDQVRRDPETGRIGFLIGSPAMETDQGLSIEYERYADRLRRGLEDSTLGDWRNRFPDLPERDIPPDARKPLMEYVKDFFVANQRCRQLIGMPLTTRLTEL